MGFKPTVFAAFLAIAVIFSVTMQPAQAANQGWLMCWVPGISSGGQECVQLPSNWRIRGVRKAYCSGGNYYCDHATQNFRVTRRNRRDLARYAPISRRDYGASVTLYSGAYR